MRCGTMSEKKEEYDMKEELKDEGKSALKEVILGGINSLGNLGRGAINVIKHHPKVEQLKEDVEQHIEEIKDSEDESK